MEAVKKAASKKATDKKVKDLKQKNAENLEKEAKRFKQGEVALTEVKYLYPEDCLTPSQRKAYRAKARAGFNKFEKKLGKLSQEPESKGKKIALKRLEKSRKEFMSQHLK